MRALTASARAHGLYDDLQVVVSWYWYALPDAIARPVTLSGLCDAIRAESMPCLPCFAPVASCDGQDVRWECWIDCEHLRVFSRI